MSDSIPNIATAETVVDEDDRATLPKKSGCIDTDELIAMTSGALPPERVEKIVEHVDGCPSCAAVIANLSKLDDDGAGGERYQLGRVLGSGAMGIVYDAWDPQLRRRVAVKVVRPDRADPTARERMLREARALARVSHPNVVAVYDVSEKDGEVRVATELVDGENLATWQAQRPVEQIIDAYVQAARGLAAAHAGGVVHRDVKPANILVGRDGRVRVGDFGLARLGDESPETSDPTSAPSPPSGRYSAPSNDDARVTETGFVAGTPAYMAPEQARGEIDARSDQFALAVALVEAITGDRPSAGAEPKLAAQPALEPAIARCLREEPADRFATMDDVVAALEAAVAPPPAPPHRRGWWIAATAAAVITVGAGVVWAAWPQEETCEAPTVPAALWSAQRRAAVGKFVTPSVLARIDRWLAAWSEAVAGVCGSERDAVLRARIERCEVEQLNELDVVLHAWETADEAITPLNAHQRIEGLRHPSECSHAALASRTDPSAAQLVGIAAVRTILDGDDDPDIRTLREQLSRAQDVGYAPLVVDVAIRLARAAETKNRNASLRILRDAIAVADKAHDELAAIEGRIELVRMLGGDKTDEAAAATEAARALVNKLGVPRLDASLEWAAASGLDSRGRHEDAMLAYERSRRAARIGYGGDSIVEAAVLVELSIRGKDNDPKAARAALAAARAMSDRAGFGMPLGGMDKAGADPEGLIRENLAMLEMARKEGDAVATAQVQMNLGVAYLLADKYQEALEPLETGLAATVKLGSRSKNVSDNYVHLASIYRHLQRPRDAIEAAQHGLAIAEELHNEALIGTALSELGSCQVAAGDPAAAKATLERALTSLERGQVSAPRRAQTRFLYATALWTSDPKRAVTVASAAREDTRAAIDALDPDDRSTPRTRAVYEGRITQIDAWLAKHPMPR